jgi:hypothetical protein
MATHPQPSFTPGRRWSIGFDVVLRTALVLAVLVMVNYLGAKFYGRFYLSSQTRVQLSSRTLSVVHSITNQIVVTVYYDKTDDWYPSIIALLNEYRSANPKISVRTVDYLRDAGEAQKIKAQYKLSSTTDKDLVIFDCDGRVKVVNGKALTEVRLEQMPNTTEREFRRKPIAFNGEMMFTTMLLAVVNPQPLKAYFLQGHGEPSLSGSEVSDYQKFSAVLAESYVSSEPLLLMGDAPVPDDCNLLIIAGPEKALKESELQKIDQYLTQGGRLFVLFNYFSTQHPTGLEPILQKWGVNVIPDTVQDFDRGGENSVIVTDFNAKTFVNPLTQMALQMVLPLPIVAVDWKNPPPNAPRVQELAYSSPESKLKVDSTAAPRSYPLMALIEQTAAPGVASTRGATRIVVTGDSFFLDNEMIKAGANRDFAGYAANWLLDRTVLLDGIGPRPVTEFRLVMTRDQQRHVRWLLLGALPGAVLLFGGLVWLVRRK